MTLYERDEFSKGLVGYWKLDDKRINSTTTAIDKVNFRDGVITDCINAQGINDINPDAMYFDGATAKIDLPDDIMSCCKDFSFSIWAKLETNIGNNMSMISFSWSVGSGIIFSREDEGAVNSKQITNLYNITPYTYDTILENDIWYHIVLTQKGDSTKLYIDGKLVETKTTQNFNSGGSTNLIGSANTIGTLQHVRLYNRVLTDGEISKLYRLKK